MRVVGVDLGSKRIGVAVSDPSGVVASPHSVVARRGDRRAEHRAIADVVEEYEAELVVVGLPRSLDGSIGPAARSALDEVDTLAGVLAVPVETVDERFTTVSAQRALRALAVPGRERRAVVDKVAAAILLQTYLDGRATTPDRPGGGAEVLDG